MEHVSLERVLLLHADGSRCWAGQREPRGVPRAYRRQRDVGTQLYASHLIERTPGTPAFVLAALLQHSLFSVLLPVGDVELVPEGEQKRVPCM